MDAVEEAIDRLLAARPRGFTNCELARALGVSQGWSHKLIARRLRSGELIRLGSGPGPYVRGQKPVPCASDFWKSFVGDHPDIVYVRLSEQLTQNILSPHLIRDLLARLHHRRAAYVFVDLTDIPSLSEAAAKDLLRPRLFLWVEPINASPSVARVLRRVEAWDHI